jgi:crotonobetainyl-CoA:carnitine CoA-transferase CaiB-like acyl-CoA transferase
MLLLYTGTGEVQGRVGNGTGSASPRGIYQARDGKWLSIAASNQAIAARLFKAMGQPELLEDPRFATNQARMANNDAIQAHVNAWVASRSRDEALKILEETEVVCSAVNDSSDIVVDPHFLERTLVEVTGVEALGSVMMTGPVLHLASYDGPSYVGVPGIGEHTGEVLEEVLQLPAERIAALTDAGVISSRR